MALYSAAYDLGVVPASVGLGTVAEGINYRGIFGVAVAVMALGEGATHVGGQR